jgi:endogenous inhibitor of DNA gyrase (YacG/DUF329 family)
VDLQRWFRGAYAVPAAEAESEDDSVPDIDPYDDA